MQNKMLWLAAGLVLVVWLGTVAGEGEVWEETEHEVLIRNSRGAKTPESCRYSKGPWTACDTVKDQRSRTLTLKKGNPALCELTKTIQKRCRKVCRYLKSQWSECSATGEMSRLDKLKPTSDSDKCEPTRRLTKRCNKNKDANKPDAKGSAKGRRGQKTHRQ